MFNAAAGPVPAPLLVSTDFVDHGQSETSWTILAVNNGLRFSE